MNESKSIFREIRRAMPPLSPVQIIILCAVTVVFSALTAVDVGGMVCIALSGAVFALLLCTVSGIVPWIVLPLSFGAAFALSADALASACALLFVPVGIALFYCVYTRRSLSVTLAVATVLIGAAVFANLTVSVTELYEGSLLQCYRAFGSDIKALFRESLSSVSYPGPDGEVYSVPEELLNILIENAVMISPAAAVVTCELLAYISVRVLRFAARLTGRDRLLFPAVYELTISVPTAALYLIALAVSFFSESASVVAYSAINITYIMMPVACGAGFNMLLGKRGIMRGRLSKGSRTVVTVMCVILAVTSPLSFFQMLAMFASIYTVVRTVMEAVKSRTDGE